MSCTRRKLLQLSLVHFLLSLVFFCTIDNLTVSAQQTDPSHLLQTEEDFGKGSKLRTEKTEAETKDLFSTEDRRQGWVILHILGIIYTYVSLIIVCDKFFILSLEVIIDKLAISDDVAGATFMAAGSSVPLCFTYVFSILDSHREVNTGSVSGLAVFNMFFVTGMCALFSNEALHLKKWPLFRDVSFYTLCLFLLIIFFLDGVIMWWESIILLTGYTVYCILMKHNGQIHQAFETRLQKHKWMTRVTALMESEEYVPAGGPEGCDEGDSNNNSGESEEEVVENDVNALSLQWFKLLFKQLIYTFLLPVMWPLWLKVPDVHNQTSRKFFVMTYLVSIVWMSIFFLFIKWLAHQVGETFGVSAHVTIVAAAASHPGLLTSVIVACKGLGDMAVSSNMGRNMFTITVFLPATWLMYSSIHGFRSAIVSTNGLLCAAVLHFLMLLFAPISIIFCKWKMSKVLGIVMLLFYVFFNVVSILLEARIIVCPVG